MKEFFREADTDAIAAHILTTLPLSTEAVVLGFQGELGAGKTTLTKSITKILGVTEQVISPTFVIAKFYQCNHEMFDTVVHIDAYRIEDVSELIPLHFTELLHTPRTLIIIEWPERIKEALPAHTIWYHISHDSEGRIITHE